MIIAVFAMIAVIITVAFPNFIDIFQPGVGPGETPYVHGGILFDVVYVLLTIATNILYLIGGGIVFFGGTIVTVRFLQTKLKDPNQPSGVTRSLSGYLTLGLAFFIGAEIIKTVVVRTPTEFSLLILVIISRGLFSLILYLERRWHGTSETE